MNTPEWQISEWLNVDAAPDQTDLLGKVVVMEVFQMLCPGCVAQGLPQAQRIGENFSNRDVLVVGLHSVFEHHLAQGHRAALAALLHEYRITFPVAIDQVDARHRQPATMRALGMQGTPTLVFFDRNGQRVLPHFGHLPDLVLGAEIERLKNSALRVAKDPRNVGDAHLLKGAARCDQSGCPV